MSLAERWASDERYVLTKQDGTKIIHVNGKTTIIPPGKNQDKEVEAVKKGDRPQ